MPLRRSRDHWVPGRDLHAVRHAPPAPSVEARPDRTPTAVVVGGGIAGLAAATGLAERGVAVTLVEAAPTLGGRVRAWPVAADGTSTTMSRGFHAFFRQYYNLRSLLRRSRPHPGPAATGGRLPPGAGRRAYRLVRRTADPAAAQPHGVRGPQPELHPPRPRPASTSTRPSGCSTSRSRGPTTTTTDVAPRRSSTSSGSLTGQGISRWRCSRGRSSPTRGTSPGASWSRCSTPTSSDRPRGCSSTCPTTTTTRRCGHRSGRYLDDLGVRVVMPMAATSLEDRGGSPGRAARGRVGGRGRRRGAGDRPGRRCSDSSLTHPGWATRRGVRGWRRRRPAPAFAVWRLWLDRPLREGTPPFLGTSGFGPLDNVSVVDQFEAGAGRWARGRNGSVVEVHAYALPDGTDEARAPGRAAQPAARPAPRARPGERRPRGVAGPRRLPAGRDRAVGGSARGPHAGPADRAGRRRDPLRLPGGADGARRDDRLDGGEPAPVPVGPARPRPLDGPDDGTPALRSPALRRPSPAFRLRGEVRCRRCRPSRASR